MTSTEPIDQRKLRQAIVAAFNENELRTLCFDLKIDYEALPPGSKVDKARELVARCLREQRIDDLLTVCEAARPKIGWRAMVETAVSSTTTPPFMGLKYFDIANADLFFGREALTEELAAHLQTNSFLAVVGASGSGKSSLVRAGLVAPLQQSSPNLLVHVFTPTDHPLEAMATALTRNSSSIGVTAKFIDAMAQDRRSLHLAGRRLVKEGQKLLLIIDQFEELFTLCRSEEDRQAFIDNLLTAVAAEANSQTNRPIRAVIALRADFYHHCAQYDDLRRLLEKQQRFIGAMNPSELRRAIEEPAKRSGLTFESGLVDLLLRDVGAGGDQPPEPGALPLLSHALLETWRRREGNQLTFAGYTEAGGVQGAIAKTAETVFQDQLSPEQQTIARNIFLRLTELGEGTQDTRRRALISELIPANDAAEATQTVLNLLSKARLVTTDEETAEVAHEALIREWPTLRLWLNDNRDGLRLHRHLTESAHDWQELGRDSGELYRSSRLAQTIAWASQNDDNLNDLEREFLAASKKAQQQEIDESQAQQQRELEQAQQLAGAEARAAKRARNFNLALVAILLLVVAGAVALLNAQRSQAIAEGVSAEATVAARETAVAAQQVDADGDGLSLTEETEYGTDPTRRDTDLDDLDDGREIAIGSDPLNPDSDNDGRIDGEDNNPLRPDISTNYIVPSDDTTRFQLEEVNLFNDFLNGGARSITGLSISKDNRAVAAGSFLEGDSGESAAIYIWLINGLLITPYEIETGIHGSVLATSFSTDPGIRLHAAIGSTVISLDPFSEGWVEAWLYNLSGDGLNEPCSAAFHPDGGSLLVGGRAKWAYFQLLANGLGFVESNSQNYNTNACYTDAIFSYGGTYFGLIEDEGQDESVFVGEVINRSFGRPFNKSVSGVIDMALSPDNEVLALGYENGRVELYDYSERSSSPPLLYPIEAHPSFANAVFSPDGTILATSSPQEGIVRLWRVDVEDAPILELDSEANGVTSLIFSPDGHYLLFGTTEGEVHVYGMPEVEK
ncbi:High-affnity carbon uptake protein Hat/HatR [hydrothermal vent metagenome]|uniref:High-affnity carbon uptake protein Hat/HatR n=1 Tax=hydrothermal vent metagenome TaxID=652676 RepID=A0A3B0VLV1_9ZZZZ